MIDGLKEQVQAEVFNTEIPQSSETVANPFHRDKLLLHQNKVAALAVGKLIAPQTIEVDLTDGACNQGCVYCCFSSGKGKQMDRIDPDKLIETLTDAYTLGTRAVELVGGGEPTAHPQVAEIIKGICTIGDGDMEVGIITNGLLAERLINVADKMTFIRVSLDSAAAETYQFLHKAKPWHFGKVLNNIRLLREAIPRQSTSRKLGIGYLVVPPYNHQADDIWGGAELAQDLGVDYIAFRPCELAESPPQEQWTEAQMAIASVRKKLHAQGSPTAVFGGFGNRWDTLKPGGHPTGKCEAMPLVAVIQANGDVAHCILLRNKREKRIGNIYEQTFEELWFSDDHQRAWQESEVSGCPNPCKIYGYSDIVRQKRLNANPVPPSVEAVAHHNFV